MAINTISVENLVTSLLPDRHYYITTAGREGLFVQTDEIGPSNNFQGGLYIKTTQNIWFKRVIYDGFVDVSWFGIRPGSGLGTINDTAMNECIRSTLSSGLNKIRFSIGVYEFNSPIAVPNGFIFTGNSTDGTTIRKVSSNSVSVFSIPSQPTAPDRSQVLDPQNVDCVFIVYHTDNTYNFRSTISNMTITGIGTSQQPAIGIYAPRVGYLVLENLSIRECKEGFVTFNCWMSKFSNVSIFQESNNMPFPTQGIVFKDDGSGLGTGTSVIFQNCYSGYLNTAYSFFGLSYSSLNCCAADHIKGRVYFLNSCKQIVFDSCGAEESSLIYPNGAGFVFGLLNCAGITINSFHTFKIFGGAANSNSAALLLDSGSQVVINSAFFSDYLSGQANSFNIIVQSGSRLVSSFLRLPSNGQSFTSFTDSTWVRLEEISNVLSQNSSTLSSIRFAKLSQSSVDAIEIKELGTTVYNTTTNRLEYWNGSVWIPIG